MTPQAREIGLVLGLAFLPIAFVGPAHGASGGWTVPRTSYGDPDLQGYWTNHTMIAFERPKELGDKAVFTEKELAAFSKKEMKATVTNFGASTTVHYDLEDYGLADDQIHLVHNLRTSIITDPEDGHLPLLVPGAMARRDAYLAWKKVHEFDSAKTRSLGERCIVWTNEGPPILPRGYNTHYQIVQTEGYVAILMEIIHDARVIPLDGRPQADTKLHNWLGDSRGHWEGDTLVVETTNFKAGLHQDFQFGYAGTTEALKVVERFSRTGPDRIDYTFTVEDPGTWTKPWSGSSPWEKVDGPIFEYACNEGNYGLPNTLSGARAEERKAAAEKDAR
jgi:hypothetical protein